MAPPVDHLFGLIVQKVSTRTSNLAVPLPAFKDSVALGRDASFFEGRLLQFPLPRVHHRVEGALWIERGGIFVQQSRDGAWRLEPVDCVLVPSLVEADTALAREGGTRGQRSGAFLREPEGGQKVIIR